MPSLFILILIQFLFCLFFFLYFRHKIIEQMQLKEYRKEIDEIIIHFNRQAEKYITHLEKLIDQHRIKNIPSPTPTEEIKTALSLESLNKKKTKNFHHPTDQLLKKNIDHPLPPQAVHSFYAQIKDMGKPINNVLNKKNELSLPPSKSAPKTKPLTMTDKIQDQVLRQYEDGANIGKIAQQLSISTAEVKLILKLKNRN